MNHKEKFHETVGILVRAYMNDTLKHGKGCACAFGNIVRSHGIDTRGEWRKLARSGYAESEGFRQLSVVGYTAEQADKIEIAFEGWGDFIELPSGERSDIFSSLMRVVDVLAEIHHIDLTEKESAKLLFVKA